MKITWTVIIALISLEIANAQTTYTWTGTNSSDWNTGSNWVNNAVPSSNTNLAYFTATTSSTTPNLSVSETIGALEFTTTATPAYTITTSSGATLTLDSAGDSADSGNTYLITDISTAMGGENLNGNVTIENSTNAATGWTLRIETGGNLIFGTSSVLTLNAADTVDSSTSYEGNLSIEGTYSTAANIVFLWNPLGGNFYYDPTVQTLGTGAGLRSASGGSIELEQNFAGSAGIAISGTGYNGATGTVAAGLVYLDANGLNETANVVMGDSAKSGNSTASYVATYVFGANASGTAATTESGNITFENSQTYDQYTNDFDVATGNTLTVSGKITDSSATFGTGMTEAVEKTGAGTLILSNSANSFVAPTTVVGGKLLITGNTTTGGTITVDSGAAFGGAGGTITSTGITVASGGGLSVSGGGAVTAGTMTLALTGGTNTLDISATAGTGAGELTFVLGTAHDEVKLSSGTLVIGNGTLSLADFTILAGSGFGAGTYTLFDTSSPAGINGTLAANGLTETIGGYSYTLVEGVDAGTLDQNIDLDVIAVPEPGSLALMLFGGAALWIMGWRYRRYSPVRA